MAARTRGSSTLITHGRGVAHPQRRAWVLLLGTLMVFSLFAAQLVRLQGLDAASVSAAAVDDRLNEVTIAAPRGSITDVSGQPIAFDVERKDVTGDPVNVELFRKNKADTPEEDKGISGAAAEIAEITGEDAEDLEDALNKAPGRFTYLVKDVSPSVWHDIDALGIPGVAADTEHKRQYPLGPASAPLLGWVGAGDQPAGGIERVRDEQLSGTPGKRTVELGGKGEVITTGTSVDTPALAGADVQLSIDSDVQWYAYDAVERRVKEAKALSGYAIVMEAKTGRLVAAASYPSFDPSKPTQEADSMRNLLVEDVYEPGSTSKLITAAAALEEGLVTSQTPIEVPVRLPRAGRVFKDAEEHPIEYLTFAGVLAKSSNMGTILYGEKINDDALHDYFTKFGYGQTTGLGLPGESTGVLPAVKDWSGSTKFTVMFGQGMSSTALQQVGVFQTIANGGVHLPPSVVIGATDAQGRYSSSAAAKGKEVIRPETAQSLTDILEEVTTPDGTAPMAGVQGYRVAGKTSTASRYDNDKGRYSRTTASFVGYAPADDPRYVVAVTVQRPTEISIYGGTISGPVFADIMRYVLQRYDVPPSKDALATMELEYDPDAPAPNKDPGVTLDDVAIKDERSGG